MIDVYKAVSARIEADWYPYHQYEWFTQDYICRHFDWREPPSRQAVSRKLYHDSTEKTAPLLEKKNRTYRIIDRNVEEMDWQSANPENVIKLKFPFGIEQYAKMFPKSVVVVAGSKNAGKTGFLYRTIIMNMNKFNIDLYNSETGSEQMKERLNGFDIEIPQPAPFRTFERYDNFADVIDPTHISVIDYLDLDSEVYMVGAEINKIWQKLTTGIAIIGLQKPPGRDLAYGGAYSAKRAVLYIVLDNNKLKLKYVKNPAQKGVNPNNMQWTFQWDNSGTDFLNIQRSYENEW